MAKIGEITVKEIHVPICLGCGYIVSETGLCDDSCKYDADLRSLENTEYHVYRRTDEYIRKEPFHGNAH